MRVLVFGAGAIGSFLGHRLARDGHDVTLVARARYVGAVRQHGLRLCEVGPGAADTGEGSEPPLDVVHPEAVERLEHLPQDRRTWDLILLTVKAYDAQSAAQALAPHVKPGVPLLIVQNGVGGEDLVRAVLPDAALISGVMTLSVSVLGLGCVRLETTRGGLNLANVTAGQQPVRAWADLFAAAGLRVATYPDYRALKWSKLLLNIQANAIPAILDWSPAAVFADRRLFAAERAAFLEAVSVMRALNLDPVGLPGYPVPLLVRAMEWLPAPVLRLVLTRLVASGRGDKRPSLQMDLASGQKSSEVLYLNGAVARHAQPLGVPVPVNCCLADVLMGIVVGRIDWETLRGRPDRLLAMLEGQEVEAWDR
jgi:2-dehydropantoate 2-reductase